MKIKFLLHLTGLAVGFVFMLVGVRAASISGTVFFDFNSNGLRDAVSEYGLPGWSLQLVPVSPSGPTVSATTDASGNYSFSSLAAGTYTLAAVNPSSWLQTSPSGPPTYSITLAASDNLTGKNFGCKQPVFVPQIEWQKTFGGIGDDYPAITRQTTDGGYVLGASSTSIPSGVKTSLNYGGYDYWVVRLDAAGNQLWDCSFGGSGDDILHSIKQTSDGGYILAGTSTSPVSGNKTSPNFGGSDWWIVKLDAAGHKLWERELGGTDDEVMRSSAGFESIIELRAGGFLIGGASASDVSANSAAGNKTAPKFNATAPVFDNQDGWLVWLDANGNIVRDLTYGGQNFDQIVGLLENPDGTILVGGHSRSEATSGTGGTKTSQYWGGNADYWFFKTDAVGNVLFDKSFGGSGQDASFGFVQLPDGNLALIGYTSGSGVSGNKTAADQGGPGDPEDFWIVKVNADGGKVWDKTYGGDDYDQLRNATVTTDGNLLLAGGGYSGISGNKVSPPFGNWDSEVILIDPNGNPIWSQNFGSQNDEDDCAATATRDGGAIITQYENSVGGNLTGALYGGNDIRLIKLAPFSCTANPFTLVSATADCGREQITVNFSAPVNPTLALQTARYTISGGAASVSAANFGASTLSVILNVSGLLPGVTYTLSVNGLVDDCGRAIAANAQLPVACPGEIHGNVFDDLNNNCIKNPTDFYLAKWPVQLLPGPRYVLTDDGGNYSFAVPAGSYTVNAVASSGGNWIQTCPPALGTYNVTVADGQVIAGRDFAFAPLGTTCADLWVSLTPHFPAPPIYNHVGGSAACCGADFIYRLDFGNSGNTPSSANGLITLLLPNLVLPANCTFVSATPSVTSLWTASGTPNTSLPVSVLFNQPVPPNYQSSVDIEVHLTCDIGQACNQQQPLLAEAIFQPFLGDCNIFLDPNVADLTLIPCCSSDPNDCTVTPKGCGPEGAIHRDQTLTYLVQFQNIGGGAAHLVVVKNTLDADLDLNTLEIVGSSHPNLFQRNGRELTWIFPNIELASAGVDENASHGYVKFRIRPLGNAPVGTAITNSAEITFDVNAPITTIITTNTITEDPVPVAAFTVTPHAGSAGFTNDFYYTGGTPGAQCQWTFGPDATPQTSTALNPANVVFTKSGQHLVGLTTSLGDCVAEPAIQMVTAGRPQLSIAKAGTAIGLSWQGIGFAVQETDSLIPPVQWQTEPVQPSAVGGWYFMTVPNAATTKFYRLAAP